MDALLNAFQTLPPEFRGLALYVLATALVNVVFTKFTDQQLADAVGALWLPAALIRGCRRLGFDPIPYLVAVFRKVRAWAEKASGSDDDEPKGGAPMSPPEDRQATPPKAPTGLHRSFMPAGVLFCQALLVTLVLAFGCVRNPQAQTPTLDTMAAGVVFGAKVVAYADTQCAKAVDNLTARGEEGAAIELSERCTKYLKLSAKALMVAEDSIYLGKAIAQRDSMCAVMLTYQTINGLAPILKQFGADLGPETDRFLGFAAPFADMGERIMCDDVKDGGVK